MGGTRSPEGGGRRRGGGGADHPVGSNWQPKRFTETGGVFHISGANTNTKQRRARAHAKDLPVDKRRKQQNNRR